MKNPPSVSVTTSMTLWQLKQAFREATINNENFDVGWWSIWDAENLEAAARLIRREIAEREATRAEALATDAPACDGEVGR
jgi:hypothetical protein